MGVGTMPPMRALKNQYLGINAHLHSLLQNEGGWDSFHGLHIGDIAKSLQTQLFPMGYVADYEPSLQIRRAGEPTYAPESDVSIYDPDPNRVQQPRAPLATMNVHEAVLEIPKVLRLGEDEIATHKAVGIYRKQAKKPDEPIVWIELLSPSNKPRGRHFETYEEKRRLLLETGIVFLEIDYLHQSPPMYQTKEIADYTRHAAGAYPYRMMLFDPHPDILDGKARVVEFAVDHPIPTLTIPLSGEDQLRFDFGIPYKKTFEEMFYGSRFDYSQLPLKFDSYSEFDQQRIASRMLWIKRAAEANLSLEIEPQPVELLPLDEVLPQLNV
jgi:Protein of unknown function (DUF4058)